MSTLLKIKVSEIKVDSGLQPRSEIVSETISEYAESMLAGAVFPPIVLFFDGTYHWLADGFHRVFGVQKAGIETLEAEVFKGTRRDALLYSFGTNSKHGMRRTNEDKRRAVRRMLHDEEWRKWSDREIARRCNVSEHTVSEVRKSICANTQMPTSRLVERNGTIFEQNTRNIGRLEPVIRKYEEQFPIPEQPVEQVKNKPTFNRTNDNIEWAWWSWNPVTGCLHNCDYCYARDIANRFYPEKFEPTFHPERLTAPANTNPIMDGSIGGRNVFVCSMADLFGKWVPQEWIDAVFDQVKNSPQWNFLFLTKFPQRLAEMDWPKNAWCGTTVDTQARVKIAEKSFSKVKAGIKWLSCEPMMERLTFSSIEIFNWIVIGGASASTQTKEFQPPWEWILHLCEQADKFKIPVYFKPNLKCRKEYPKF